MYDCVILDDADGGVMALLIMMVLTLEVFVVGSDDGGDDAI